MGDSGIFKTGHQVWQRANIMAAANFLREQLTRMPDDFRVRSIYEGLLEVLDPSRRTVRIQRERHAAAQASTIVKVERRARDRRGGHDRRASAHAAPGGIDRRSGSDRRTGRDRRRLG